MYLQREQIENLLRHCPKDEGRKIIEDFRKKLNPYLDSVDVKDVYDEEYQILVANHPTAYMVNRKYPIHIYAISAFNYLKNKIRESDNVLEIGCGCGNFLLGLMEKTSGNGCFIGVDFSEYSINEAMRNARKAERGNCEFFCCDANHFKSKVKFDYVILNDVIEHLSDREMKKLMNSCIKMLDKNGEIVMHTPNGLNIGCQSDQTMLSWLYYKIKGDSVIKCVRQLYHEQVHINVKSYRQWKRFFQNCGYVLDVKYDRERYTEGGIASAIDIMREYLLPLNGNMLLIAKRMK